MLSDQCAQERELANQQQDGRAAPVGVVHGVQIGCFPDLDAARAGTPPNHIITPEAAAFGVAT